MVRETQIVAKSTRSQKDSLAHLINKDIGNKNEDLASRIIIPEQIIKVNMSARTISTSNKN